MAQLAKCMIMANNDSPLMLRMSDVTVFGRHGNDFLKASKVLDYEYYKDIFNKDKINKIP